MEKGSDPSKDDIILDALSSVSDLDLSPKFLSKEDNIPPTLNNSQSFGFSSISRESSTKSNQSQFIKGIRSTSLSISNSNITNSTINLKRPFDIANAPPPVIEKPCLIYKGIKIYAGHPHIATKLDIIFESPKFRKWLDDFNTNQIDFKEFTITDVDFFGPVNPLKLGFVKGFGLAFDKETGDPIPSVVFLRGNSIAVLIIVKIKETGEMYILLCNQLRFPSGRALTEACAGMIDDQTKHVIGVVFNEVKEETGFIIKQQELIDLGTIRPSGGGCDEVINLYAWESEITQDEFNEKNTNIFGNGKHEKIKLKFYVYEEFDSVLDVLEDVKAECCWRRYLRSKDRKFTLN